MKNNFTPIKWHTFVFGLVQEDQLSTLVTTAESLGAEVLQYLPGNAQAGPSLLAPPGTKPTMVRIIRLVVRIPLAELEAFNARVTALNNAVGGDLRADG